RSRSSGSSGRATSDSRGCAFERGQQRLELVAVVVPDAVDVEGRSSVDAAADAAHEVFAHAVGMDVPRELLVELPAVEPELLGVPVEVALLEVLLILVEEVVHLPELLPRRRRLGGLR